MNKPKFRAWDDVNKIMVTDFNERKRLETPDGFYMHSLDVVNGNEIYAKLKFATRQEMIFRPFKEMSLMQYTGLKDKNGVEIYEGDVVKQTAGEYSYIGAVEKDCYQFYIDGINPFDSYSFDDVADTSDCTADLTIIGNIHANPELLNEVEK